MDAENPRHRAVQACAAWRNPCGSASAALARHLRASLTAHQYLTARNQPVILSTMYTHSPEDDTRAASARDISPVPTGAKLRRLLWSIIQSTLYRCSFHTCSRWRAFLLRLFGAKIGRRCTIRRTSKVYYPWLLEMGDLSCLGDHSEVYNLGRVVIDQRVSLSQHAYLCAGTHDYTRINMPLVTMPITIGDDAFG